MLGIGYWILEVTVRMFGLLVVLGCFGELKSTSYQTPALTPIC